ncbi:fimbria/pilus periplasmic chaperone [Klebsiella sp. BIGb0407]|uniref:fimbria/pilus periplasmic chaperone n=1 Tax=Klebsiella sp. BIGb0407 TaxID=2940603 RepID=UPI0021698786|nr:fimbria/pilus periplasmic chaperone [Klebsiella sp. BIGb0407]
MKKHKHNYLIMSLLTGGMLLSQVAQGAIALDRTRVIFDGDQKSITLNISNNNKQLPYLAQGWLENSKGDKINSPLVVLPPMQRVEPGAASQIKIEALPAISQLPQDKESLFYFNLREVPPKSDKPNTLQIALQTRVKLFYRPKAIKLDRMATPIQDKLTLNKSGDKMMVKNPTPYYVTIINATENDKPATLKAKDFTPVMIAPFGEASLGVKPSELGNRPVLTYINDYGGRPMLTFQCQSNECKVVENSATKK